VFILLALLILFGGRAQAASKSEFEQLIWQAKSGQLEVVNKGVNNILQAELFSNNDVYVLKFTLLSVYDNQGIIGGAGDYDKHNAYGATLGYYLHVTYSGNFVRKDYGGFGFETVSEWNLPIKKDLPFQTYRDQTVAIFREKNSSGQDVIWVVDTRK
jgi:hypothetical protein